MLKFQTVVVVLSGYSTATGYDTCLMFATRKNARKKDGNGKRVFLQIKQEWMYCFAGREKIVFSVD
jgi:hypothetical protein